MQKEDAQNTAPVWVTLFGAMQFSRETPSGQNIVPLRFKTQKACLLLAYLLLHQGKKIRREYLATLFWPESDGEYSRRSLRDALRFVRTALTDAGFPDMGIEANQNTLCLLPGTFATDTATFESALREANRTNADPETQRAALENAIRLYLGPFLQDCFDTPEAEAWIELARRRYAASFDDARVRLSQLYQKQDEQEQVLRAARRAGENDAENAAQPPDQRVEPLPGTAAVSAVPITGFAPVAAARHSRKEFLGGAAMAVVLGAFGALAARNFIGKPAELEKTSTVPPSPPKPYHDADPGNLAEPNPYVAPAAQNMELADYDRTKSYYDRLLAKAASRDERIVVASQLLELGRSAHFRDKGQGWATLSTLDDALTIFRREKDQGGIIETLFTLAQTSLLLGNHARSVACYKEVQDLLPAVKEPMRWASYGTNMGELSLDLGQYKKARDYLEPALTIYGKAQTPAHQRGMAHVVRFLGQHASDTGDYPSAQKYLNEANDRLTRMKDTHTHAEVLGLLGTLALRQNQTDEAINLYQQGFDVWAKQKHGFYEATFKANLARAYFYKGCDAKAKGDSQGENVQFRRARNLAEDSLRLFTTSNGPVVRGSPLYVLGRINFEEGRMTESGANLHGSLKLREQIGNPRTIAEAQEALATLECFAGSISKAKKRLLLAADLRKKAGTPPPPCDTKFVADLRRVLKMPPLS